MNKKKRPEAYYNDFKLYYTLKKFVFFGQFIAIFIIIVIYLVIQYLKISHLDMISSLLQYLLLLIYFIVLSAMMYSLILSNNQIAIVRYSTIYLTDLGLKEAKNGDRLRLSLIIKELLNVIYVYLRQKSFKLGKIAYLQSELLYINISSLKQGHILKYLQVNNCIEEFEPKLSELNKAFKRKNNNKYIIAQNLMLSLIPKVEEYNLSSRVTNKVQSVVSSLTIPLIISNIVIAIFTIFKLISSSK